ncbi:MAG TPA: hypothetical protein VK763_08620 [Terriglobales bacterium]|nr:hypothetical protein [Terriglobales bacterium]
MKPKDLLILLLLTIGALLIHGYHPWVEDSEIYVPGVLKTLHPELFPFNAQFFETHAGSTVFPNFVATSVRLSQLPLSDVLFVLHVASIFLFLLACWQLISRCFPHPKARWAGVALIAALLTLPVAGTALYILDQYLNPRNLTAFAAIFAIVKVIDKKYIQAALFLILTAAIHPLMAVFAFSYCVLLVAAEYADAHFAAIACLLPFGLSLDPPSSAYHQAALTHGFHYITRWTWYEWLGVLAPIPILWCFSRLARSRDLRNLDLLCRALVVYEVIYLPMAVLLSTVPRFESLARLQPMRSLWLLYVLMFLFLGGFLGEYLLKNKASRWLALFVPLGAGMFLAQLALFPASQHIEWHGDAPTNPWSQAFLWARDHTPTDAIFALDPEVLKLPGEDEQGFRAIAQRSRLADRTSDAGAVSMFPALADEWFHQVQAQTGWKDFQAQDFQRLHTDFGVTWVVLQSPGVPGLDCPYGNPVVQVCRL